jgi:hypothetical protein
MSQGLSIAEPVGVVLQRMSVQEALDRYQAMVDFVHKILHEGVDYGVVPGTDKPTLLQPGAEKLSTFFKMHPVPEIVEKELDWTGKNHDGEPFFFYHTRYHLYDVNGVEIAAADGSCNSMETRYRWRWVREGELPPGADKDKLKSRPGTLTEYTFAIEKAETGGKYGKTAEYWQAFKDAIASGTAKMGERADRKGVMRQVVEIGGTLYRIPNPEICDLPNTILKQAAKRAHVASVKLGANASEFFTQDTEDFEEGEFRPVPVEEHGTSGQGASSDKSVGEKPSLSPIDAMGNKGWWAAVIRAAASFGFKGHDAVIAALAAMNYDQSAMDYAHRGEILALLQAKCEQDHASSDSGGAT